LLQPDVVESRKLLCIVEVGIHWVGLRRMLMQEIEPQLVGPPVAIRRTAAVVERTLGLC
jgi:hypothetical protein